MSYLAQPLATRAVHLRITPRPSNLGESREILRLLGQFGEIEYFKSLKYDGQGLGRSHPGVGLVIFREEEGAKKCFRGSPVRFRMGRVVREVQNQQKVEEVEEEEEEEEDVHVVKDAPTGKWGLSMKTPFGLQPERQKRYSSTSALPEPPERPLRMPFDPPSPPDLLAAKQADEERFFQILTSPSRRNYRETANLAQWHGAFKMDSKMFGQEDLAKRVPLKGLSCVDWKGRQKHMRIVLKEKRGREGRERLGALWERWSRGEVGKEDTSGRVGGA